MSGKVLSEWFAPTTILVVMRPTDSVGEVLGAVRHSSACGARVLLVEIASTNGPVAVHGKALGTRKVQLRDHPEKRESPWPELLKQCFYLHRVLLEQIPDLVRAFKVGRVTLGADFREASLRDSRLESNLLHHLDIPVCVLGRNAGRAEMSAQARRMLVPAEAITHTWVPFQFASAIAQAEKAKVSIVRLNHRSRGRSADTCPGMGIRRSATVYSAQDFAERQRKIADVILRAGMRCSADLIVLPFPRRSMDAVGTRVLQRIITHTQSTILFVPSPSAGERADKLPAGRSSGCNAVAHSER